MSAARRSVPCSLPARRQVYALTAVLLPLTPPPLLLLLLLRLLSPPLLLLQTALSLKSPVRMAADPTAAAPETLSQEVS